MSQSLAKTSLENMGFNIDVKYVPKDIGTPINKRQESIENVITKSIILAGLSIIRGGTKTTQDTRRNTGKSILLYCYGVILRLGIKRMVAGIGLQLKRTRRLSYITLFMLVF